jgi:maltooligosyltrehalose trehalohydrolase
VLLFAPDAAYGRPEDLKGLIDACHERGLCVFLDVVYNHFGPDGNYLPTYAPDFFTERHKTPWGAAVNFDGRNSRPVRDFYIHNALYWLEEYRFDGLRFDAVHAILDDSRPDIVTEIAETIRRTVTDRPVHLILENDKNQAGYLGRDSDGQPRLHTAQWNDDVHHVLRVLTSGQRGGYYADYADRPAERLARLHLLYPEPRSDRQRCLRLTPVEAGIARRHSSGGRDLPADAADPDAISGRRMGR